MRVVVRNVESADDSYDAARVLGGIVGRLRFTLQLLLSSCREVVEGQLQNRRREAALMSQICDTVKTLRQSSGREKGSIITVQLNFCCTAVTDFP
jgi:hypothetical protein